MKDVAGRALGARSVRGVSLGLLALALFPRTSHSGVQVSADGDRIVYDVAVTHARVAENALEGRLFSKVVLEGVSPYEGKLAELGKPELPVVRIYVDGEGPIHVESDASSVEQLAPLMKPVKPVQPGTPKSFVLPATLIIDAATYALRTYLPLADYTVTKVGTVRGVTRRLVTLHPFRYNPATGQERLVHKFRVVGPAGSAPKHSIARRETFALVVGAKFEGSPALARLEKAKAFEGYDTVRIVIGKDARTPDEIRRKLAELYREKDRYLAHALIVGDQADVPGWDSPRLVRELSSGFGFGGFMMMDPSIFFNPSIFNPSAQTLPSPIPGLPPITIAPPTPHPALPAPRPVASANRIQGVTDHYYRCLDTDDYESDIGTPDIGVGRYAVSTEEELSRVVERQLRYELGTFKTDHWLRSISFIASDDSKYWTVAEGTDNYVIGSYTKPREYDGDFPSAPSVGGDKLYAITHKAKSEHVIERLKLGRGIVNYGGHGVPEKWAGPEITKGDLDKMTDPDVIPAVFANACLTGSFIADSFAEAWQRHPNGSVLYWGSMSYTYWDEDDIVERRMYDAIYHDHELTVDRFTGYSLADVWRHFGGEKRSKYYWETYVSFGDPSLSLRTWDTRVAKLEGPRRISRGVKTATYRVVDASGAPARGARVALVADDGAYRVAAETGADGRVRLPVGPGARFHVTVSGDNLRLASWRVKVR